MDKFTRAEKMFDAHLKKLQQATSVKELVELETFNGIPFYTMKFFNKKFKGDLEKSREYVIKEAHRGLNNTIESMLEEDF